MSFVNEVTLGPFLKDGVVCQENQPCDWRFRTISPTPTTNLWAEWGVKGGGLEVKFKSQWLMI